MSTWTHVNGIIRFDGIAGMTPAPEMGNTCQWESPESDWEKCDVPCGSEGSLEYHVITNPDPSHLARWTVAVWGDLRDYSDYDAVLEYFNRVTSQGVRSVRGGTFSVYVSRQSTRTYSYNPQTNKFEEVHRWVDKELD